MADLATPSAATISTMDGASTPVNKEKSTPVAKPERPDDETFKSELAKAEKELNASNERMVCSYVSAVHPAISRTRTACLDWHHRSLANTTTNRKPSRPSLTSQSQTTRTLLPPNASKNSAPNSHRSVSNSRAASLAVLRSSTRLSALMSSSSPASPNRRLPAHVSTSSPPRMSRRRLSASRSRLILA